MTSGRWGRWPALMLVWVGTLQPLHAQTDEIQVYGGDVENPGKSNLTFHANYTPRGRGVPSFPGGVVPQHSLNGAFEWALGLTEWFEAGTYLPVYTLTGDRTLKADGVKIRTLFATPHSASRNFFYGVNFELSLNSRHWDQSRYAGEIRPIVGVRTGRWGLTANPILDTSFDGFANLDFAPCLRVAYSGSRDFTVAFEHYADFGPLHRFNSAQVQDQTLFAVADYARRLFNLEAGIGFGLTSSSDKLVLKMIVSHTF